MLERALSESGGWEHFREKQRHANIKKFISMVETFESGGLSHIEIREKLLRQRHAREVSKANINAEGMDAVRIMTVHAAKGLQFPMVFIPSLEESTSPWTGPIAIDDEGGRITLGYEEDSSKRDRNEIFRRKKQKGEEEEKRLFYVAVTRARDYLCMLGTRRAEKTRGRLSYLEEAFGPLEKPAEEMKRPFTVLGEGDLAMRAGGTRLELSEAGPFVDAPAYTEPLSYQPPLRWRDVTEDLDIRTRHGENWVVAGSVMHRIFEELSKGILREEDIPGRAGLLLRAASAQGLIGVILEDIGKLKERGYLKGIIMPRENAHTELPFVLEKGKSVFKGRIDRLIIEEGGALLYDYKTFPVRDGEVPGLKEKYGFQMELYREAVERLFKVKTRAFLLFTHRPEIVEL
jgi:ATP-dependent helicase/nuclease subunit A